MSDSTLSHTCNGQRVINKLDDKKFDRIRKIQSMSRAYVFLTVNCRLGHMQYTRHTDLKELETKLTSFLKKG